MSKNNQPAPAPAGLPTLNLSDLERLACEAALAQAESIAGASALLGTNRHALKRRIIKHRIEWPRTRVAEVMS